MAMLPRPALALGMKAGEKYLKNNEFFALFEA